MQVPYQESLNHGRFETWTVKPDMELVHVKQVHGVAISTLDKIPCEADGMVVMWEDLKAPLAIKTADCMPIVIEGEKGVVFLHAGWRGLADGILRRPEIADIKPTRALIGPCIHECCFEVSEDFQNNFRGSKNFIRREGSFAFNLTEEAKEQLQGQYPRLSVQVAPACTGCDTNFHSYRKTKTTERNWNLYIKG